MAWLIVLVLCTGIAYFMGKESATSEINQRTVREGVWVQVLSDTKSRFREDDRTLTAGTLGIVTGRDKWGRLSLWVATPQIDDLGKIPQVFDVDMARVRAIPSEILDTQTVESTRRSLAAWLDPR